MSRRGLATALITAILMSLAASPSQASPKPGKKCTKVGATVVHSGTKFTCVRSGTKLTWNKGTRLVTAKPAAATTPAPPNPTAPTSFDDLVENYRGISYAAWNKSGEKIARSSPFVFSLKITLGPTSKLIFQNPELAYNLVSQLYEGFDHPTSVHLLAFNFDDRDWAARQMDALMPDPGSRWLLDLCRSRNSCQLGGSFADQTGSNVLIVQATEVPSETTLEGALDAHEFTHGIQQAVMRGKNPWPMNDPWPPAWYWEGHAQFTQNAAIHHKSFGTTHSDGYKLQTNCSETPCTTRHLSRATCRSIHPRRGSTIMNAGVCTTWGRCLWKLL
jgi:hypothetical protein